MTADVFPSRCPHVARKIYRHETPAPGDDRLWWTCHVCGIDTVSFGWPEFDAQAGCADWERDQCGHERCAALREDARDRRRRGVRA